MQNHGSSDAVTNYPAVAEPLETSVQQHLERVSGATDTLLTLFWLGQILSGLGNAFATIAIPLLVLQATGSVAVMGLVTAIFGVGVVVTGVVLQEVRKKQR